MKVPVYSIDGKTVGEQELSKTLFGVTPDPGLVHEAFREISLGSRQVLAHTKTRGEVRGGGKKPWKQKGTGRARHGSIRSPIWKGGGVVFGPRSNHSFAIKMNRKAKQKALLMCLSDKVNSEQLVLLDMVPETLKTKTVELFILSLPFSSKKTLIALGREEKGAAKAMGNIRSVGVLGATHLNVKDLLNYPNLVVSKKGMEELEKVYLK